jgi:hypothetical protein
LLQGGQRESDRGTGTQLRIAEGGRAGLEVDACSRDCQPATAVQTVAPLLAAQGRGGEQACVVPHVATHVHCAPSCRNLS